MTRGDYALGLLEVKVGHQEDAVRPRQVGGKEALLRGRELVKPGLPASRLVCMYEPG